jgi:glutaredoxin 2
MHKILPMKKVLLLPLLLLSLFLASCDVLQEAAGTILSEPSIEEIGRGLKEALTNGITKGATALSQKDGYFKSAYKILLPADVRKVTDKLKSIPGFSNIENELIEKMNRGAEDAAKEATPIFVSAIRGMTIQDATNILMGSENAATQYLNKTTNKPLYDAFKPKIVNSLDKIGANDLWRKAVDTYNKIPLVTKVNNDLGDYVTNEALKGLFSKIEEEEKNIRKNKLARTSELLRKVFAKQDR